MIDDERAKLRVEYAALKKQVYELDDRRRDIERQSTELLIQMGRIERWFEEEGEKVEPDAN